MTTALVVRIILFRSFKNASDNAARSQAVKEPMDKLRKKMQESMGDPMAGQVLRHEMAEINRATGFSLWKLLQAPLFASFFGFGAFKILRAMSALPVPGLIDGGFLWLRDLTIPDPYYIVPAAIGGFMYFTFKVSICSAGLGSFAILMKL